MKKKYQDIRLWVGGWVILGLSVAGINGHILFSLLDSPLSGYSREVRRVDRGLRQIQSLLSAETEEIGWGLGRLAKRYTVVHAVVPPQPKIRSLPPAEKKVTRVPVSLPKLTGVITRLSADRIEQRFALLDGTVCTEGDQVGSLTVKEVSANGVRLSKGKKHWFIEAPDNTYSLTVQ